MKTLFNVITEMLTINEVAESFNGMGVDNTTYGQYWGDDMDYMFDLHVADSYSENVNLHSHGAVNGSPPENRIEQKARMNYITNVFNKQYYQDRYKPIEGEYLAYLYPSHYTENVNYDPADPQASFPLQFNEEFRVEIDRIGIRDEDTVLSLMSEIAGIADRP